MSAFKHKGPIAAREAKTNNELAAHIMRPALEAASRRLLQTLTEIDKTQIQPLENTIKALIANPHGCTYCDYGKLRRPPKFPHSLNTEHDEDCGFAMAEKLGFPLEAQP